jgi:hypothetical protein
MEANAFEISTYATTCKPTFSCPAEKDIDAFFENLFTSEDLFAGFTAEELSGKLTQITEALCNIEGCPIKKPPVKEPPVKEPLVKEPPVKEPLVKEPPVKEPPVKEPLVKEPPVKEPPVKEPPVKKRVRPIDLIRQRMRYHPERRFKQINILRQRIGKHLGIELLHRRRNARFITK